MKKLLYFLTNCILLALCVYAIHDMQTAQGVGLYFASKIGCNRLIFDIVTDAVFTLLLVLLLLIPQFARLSANKGRVARFFLLFVAFMPSVRCDYVFSLFFNPSVYDEGLAATDWISEILNAYSILVPVLVLSFGFALTIKGTGYTFADTLLPAISAILMLPGLFVPAVNTACLFVGAYLLLMVIYHMLEKANFESKWFNLFLFLASVYRILTVTAAWNL